MKRRTEKPFRSAGRGADAHRYECEAVSVEGFLSQLIRYVSTGHYFYFAHELKPTKDPYQLDEKIINEFNLNTARWRRWRRPKGTASVHYLRFDRTYVVLATHTDRRLTDKEHPLFSAYRGQVRDIGREAFTFRGYKVIHRWCEKAKKRKVKVWLDSSTYQALRGELLDLAKRPRFESRELMERIFLSRARRFQPYGPVHEQIVRIFVQVNNARRYRGLKRIRKTKCVPRFIAPTKVFRE